MTRATYLLHCDVCGDVQYVTSGHRAYCRCERSSARLERGAVVVAGPGRVVLAGGGPVDISIVRPSVAVGT